MRSGKTIDMAVDILKLLEKGETSIYINRKAKTVVMPFSKYVELEQQLKDCRKVMKEAAKIIVKLTNYDDGYPYMDEVKLLKGGK